jgi:hypothetical protein
MNPSGMSVLELSRNEKVRIYPENRHYSGNPVLGRFLVFALRSVLPEGAGPTVRAPSVFYECPPYSIPFDAGFEHGSMSSGASGRNTGNAIGIQNYDARRDCAEHS